MKINTRKQAIDEKCKDCIYDSLGGGTWKEQTENCPDNTCSLYSFRPLTNATLTKIREEKYINMSPEEKEKADLKAQSTRERFAK